MHHRIIATIVAGMLVFPPSGVSAADDSEGAVDGTNPVAVETYTGPKSVDLAQPAYPRAQISRNQEGWVHLNFMVDTQGKPYEITVADSVGDEVFQKAAIEALKRSEFEPARLDGVPIESGANYSYAFELQGDGNGARPRFVRRYRKLIDAIQAGDRSAADEALADLDADNLYENAYLQFARFTYYRAWGSVHQQVRALNRAVGRDDATTYLRDEVLQSALQNLFALQTRLHDFGGALHTAARLYGLPLQDDLKAKLDHAVENIKAFRHHGRSIAVEGSIDGASYSWYLTLFKSSFYIDQVRGRVSEIKLRCKGKFVGFAFDESLVYRVSDRHMPCSLEVVGDPGTLFRLVEGADRPNG